MLGIIPTPFASFFATAFTPHEATAPFPGSFSPAEARAQASPARIVQSDTLKLCPSPGCSQAGRGDESLPNCPHTLWVPVDAAVRPPWPTSFQGMNAVATVLCLPPCAQAQKGPRGAHETGQPPSLPHCRVVWALCSPLCSLRPAPPGSPLICRAQCSPAVGANPEAGG